MPAEGIGIYPYEETAGNEVSSTYEGRHITVREGELIHPFHADDLVNKGDPVIVCLYSATHNHATYGRAVGIALASATAVTDYIAVDTEGIWMGQVYADDDNGTQDIEAGDALFISDDSTGTDASIAADGTGDAAISKIRDNVLQVPFGYALGRADAGNAGTMSVKVHWDPRSHLLLDNEKLYFGDGVAAVPDVSLEWTGAALEMLPLGDNIDFLIGDGTNSFDVQIFGDAAANYLLWDSAVSTLNIVNTQVPIGDRALDIRATQTNPNSEGLSAYFEGTINGNQANVLYNVSSWINVQTGHVGNQWISPYEGGLSCSAGTGTNLTNVAYGAIYGYFGDAKPANMFVVWRINTQPGIGAIDAVIHAANADSIGFQAQGVSETTVSMGVVPLAYIVGTAAVPGFVRLYADNL